MAASETRLGPGRVLCGKWRVDRKLGEGGMATVWAGSHRNGRPVAIKVLRQELGADEAVRARFLREGYVANRVQHPGVVAVLDDDVTEDGVVFLVMELLEGMTLKELWLERNRQLQPGEVVDIAMRILGVLEAAHAENVVHRDLKPDNVFLLKEGGLKILDFGIARLREMDTIDQHTRTGDMLGTPAFMPPEQALGHWDRVDARSDIWAIGATMWTLLSGGLVHSARTLQELMVFAATQQARSIKAQLPDLHPRLAKVIDRALCFNQQDRWSSATRMRAALDRLSRVGATDVMPMRPAPPSDQVGAHGSWEGVGNTVPSPPSRRDVKTVPFPQATNVIVGAHDTGMPTTSRVVAAPPRRAALVAVALGVCALAAVAWWIIPANRQEQPATVERPATSEPHPVPTAEASVPESAPPRESALPVETATPPPSGTATRWRAPVPRKTEPVAPPTLDCKGADFANPACARGR